MQGRLLSRAFAAIARHNTSSDSRSLLKGIHGRCQGFSSQSELCREPPVLLVRVLEGAGVRVFSTTPSLFPKVHIQHKTCTIVQELALGFQLPLGLAFLLLIQSTPLLVL